MKKIKCLCGSCGERVEARAMINCGCLEVTCPNCGASATGHSEEEATLNLLVNPFQKDQTQPKEKKGVNMEKIKCPNCGEMVEPKIAVVTGMFTEQDDEYIGICPECGATTYKASSIGWVKRYFRNGNFDTVPEVEKKDQVQVLEEEQPDMVSHPSHYINDKGVECQSVIDYVLDNLVLTASAAYWLGCSIKYLFRYTRKGKPIQDLDKALFCFKKAIKKLKKHVAKTL